MSKMNQKTAVFAAITAVLAEDGVEFHEGMNVGPVMTKERRARVNAILVEGFKSKSIELDREYTDSDLKSYVSGLQSNWIRKDSRLNGDTKYVAKNPGSRAGSTDPQLKAMRALLSQPGLSEADKSEIQSHIDARVKQIEATKAVKTVDYSNLPPELAAKFAKQ